jgi:LysM repeat protein
MKKTPSGIGAVVAGLAVLTLFAAPAPAAERPGFETYVVRSGDTLSKISGRVFGDVKRWREILKENPQVTNANRIFPGDTLLVPVPATAAPAGGAGGGLVAGEGAAAGMSGAGLEAVAAPAPTGDQGAGADAAAGAAPETGAEADTTAAAPEPPARAVPVVSPALYRAAGFIADRLPAIAIVASQDNRILLGTDDAAIVNQPILCGTRFTVVRAERRVFHPVTRQDLGWLIRILGSAEVTCRGERTSTVALRAMNADASVGDFLLPIDPNDVLEQNGLADRAQPECIPAGACDGVIVAFNEDRLVLGEQDLAYIDRGTAAGVKPGQRFTIYREVAPESRIAVGELQVLRAGVTTSTALITTSVQELQVGYLLRAR